MILVKEILGNINFSHSHARYMDFVPVEWYEKRKRILHKKTINGVDITLKFLYEQHELKQGDILYENAETIVAVDLQPCECIVIEINNLITASAISYEIGNRHLPLFYEGSELLTPMDIPLLHILEKAGYKMKIENRKLDHSFYTSVLPHIQFSMSSDVISNINK